MNGFDPGVPEMAPGDARSAVAGGAPILDVREPWEYDQARIEGAVHIPLGQLPTRLHEVPKGSPLVVYCHLGARSAAAVQWLRANGRRDSVNLAGGIQRWMSEGLPVR